MFLPATYGLAVYVTMLLLGGIGINFMPTGRAPSFPSWVWAGVLLFCWGSVLLDLLHYGSKAFSRGRWMGVLGGTLFAGSQLVPHLGWVAFRGKNVGLLVIMWIVIGPWVEFGKRPPPAPSDIT